MKVMTFGSFDGLHKGHLSYFKQAKKYGDYLIAVIARDENIFKQKKHLPKYDELNRMKEVVNCGLVDKVILGNKNIYDVLIAEKPDIICLGYDQKADIEFLHQNFSQIKIVRLKSYKPNIYKSSLLNH
ncbi:FAD synthase [Candidatus Falkowbacteria bacterium CG10_big_fil_rev_8_21_14_0_10_37_6]|uniref:FAD synthase n=1 Tax=Candidatus Falkowbacteria bacterium CG10_big_fil_rev_8_21_14_0_10_37_6 TaxID=1974563 RepID=A0A2H0V6W5_9BACT|nr:MAG: FAD synthase [Candidatus Falkowbacteria bacterium CG10_big_fil_rev_8_21_14_0_10_37_6]